MWREKHIKAIPKAKIVKELEKAHICLDQLHKQIKAMRERLAKKETESKRTGKLEVSLG